MKKNFWEFQKILLLMIFSHFSFQEGQAATCLTTDQDSSQKTEEVSVSSGAALFEGSVRFDANGPACNSCHNLNSKMIVSGGLLAKDLTNAFSRLGSAGISGIIGSPPFPAMSNAYSNNKLTEGEIADLVAFLEFVDSNGGGQKSNSNDELFLGYAPIGLIIWLVLIYFIWYNRKKETVKKDVYDRQIKPIN